MSINICELCYTKVVEACQSTYIVTTGLDHDLVYWLFLEDINGNLYKTQGQPDGIFGEWNINTHDYSPGMFNAYSGDYILTWSKSDNIDDQVDLTINGETYPCIILKFKQVV